MGIGVPPVSLTGVRQARTAGPLGVRGWVGSGRAWSVGVVRAAG
jgi:hypothetical protein